MRTTIAAAMLLASVGAASASASLACEANDPAVEFALEGGWGRSAGSGVNGELNAPESQAAFLIL